MIVRESNYSIWSNLSTKSRLRFLISLFEKKWQKKRKFNSQNRTQQSVLVSCEEAQWIALDQCSNSTYVFKSAHLIIRSLIKYIHMLTGTRAPTLSHVGKTRLWTNWPTLLITWRVAYYMSHEQELSFHFSSKVLPWGNTSQNEPISIAWPNWLHKLIN